MPAEVTAAALKRALDRGELFLEYQPIVGLGDNRPHGFEALLRWRHPDIGTLFPGVFLPLAESTSLIIPIGEWALRTACIHAATWQAAPEVGEPGLAFRRRQSDAGSPLTVAVNLSPRQFAYQNVAEIVRGALEGSGISGDRLWLEITETALMQENNGGQAMLRELNEAYGVRVAIDDFGIGYSSMLYLRDIPAQQMKIDKSFVDGLGKNKRDGAIVLSLIALAHALGMEAIAEGVETEGQAVGLALLGCDSGQGYLWHKPMPAEAVEFYLLNPDAQPEVVE
jgi:EAL domain-containing protein (putative c-di-GMP-specific phosphodiesterase class I)